MNNKEDFVREYSNQFNEYTVLPDEWESKYIVIGCLKEDKNKKTYLLKEKTSQNQFIMKTASEEAGKYLRQEGMLLKELGGCEEIHAPCFIELKEIEGTTWLLRQYQEGSTLARIAERCSLSEEETVNIAIKLCEEVRILHERSKPIIHRDIKPENIILGYEYKIHLIDFETTRYYAGEKREDTNLIGTKGIAAPEQYGFGQTDERTDIYGIGKTILYLITGSYELDALKENSCSNNLKKIIARCCQFDPQNRYDSVKQLQSELKKLRKQKNLFFKSAIENKALIFLNSLLLVSVCFLSYKILKLENQIVVDKKDAKSQSAEENNIDSSNDYMGRFVLFGWDITEYNILLGDIFDSYNMKDYDSIAKLSREMIEMLYEDDFIASLEDSEDTYKLPKDDELWDAYYMLNTGHDIVADKLLYNDKFLLRELENFDQYKYVITGSMTLNLKETWINDDGSLKHSLLYQYMNAGEKERKELPVDECISCFMDVVISGIENYQSVK